MFQIHTSGHLHQAKWYFPFIRCCSQDYVAILLMFIMGVGLIWSDRETRPLKAVILSLSIAQNVSITDRSERKKLCWSLYLIGCSPDIFDNHWYLLLYMVSPFMGKPRTGNKYEEGVTERLHSFFSKVPNLTIVYTSKMLNVLCTTP